MMGGEGEWAHITVHNSSPKDAPWGETCDVALVGTKDAIKTSQNIRVLSGVSVPGRSCALVVMHVCVRVCVCVCVCVDVRECTTVILK